MELAKLLKSFLVIISFIVAVRVLRSAHYLSKSVTFTNILNENQLERPEVLTVVRKHQTIPVLGEPEKAKLKLKTNYTITNFTITTKPQNRTDNCSNCFVHDFKYLVHNNTVCSHAENARIDMIIIIFTIHGHTKIRNVIRETWVAIAKGNSANVRYVFLLGEIKNKKLMDAVISENKRYGDIIMEDFVDSYANLTYKTIMGMKWATLNCADARFILKTDDDMWVNVPEMVKLLTSHEKELQTSVGGACMKVAYPIRHKASKWYASIRSYPNTRYPGFCSGTGYVTSLAVAKKLYEVSSNVPFFHLEDVYIALCVKKLGFTLRSLKGFHNWRTALIPCQMRSPSVLTSHGVPIDFIPKVMAANCSNYRLEKKSGNSRMPRI